MQSDQPKDPAKAPQSALPKGSLSGLAWVVSGAAAQTLIKLLVLAILARVLAPYEFGLVALSMMLGTFVLMACRIGFGPALVQMPNLSQSSISAAMTMAIPVSALAAGGLVLATPAIADFFDEPLLVPLLYLNALVPFMQGISQVPESLLQRDLKFKVLTLLDGVSFVFGYGAVSIVLALNDFGAISVIYGLVAQEVIRTILLFSIRFVRPSLDFAFSHVRGLVDFGFGISLVQTTNMAAYQLDNFVVSKTLGGEALGFYSRAYQVITVPTKLIGNSLIKALFPAMSLIQQDEVQIRTAFINTMSGIALITMPVTVVMVIFAPEIVMVMLGDQWGEAVVPFQILGLAIFFRVGHKVCEAVIRAKGTVYRLWLRQLTFAGSVLAFAYAGHGYGINGVAIGVLLACVLNYLILVSFARSLLKAKIGDLLKSLPRQLALAIPFALVLWGLSVGLDELQVGALPHLVAGLAAAGIMIGVPLWLAPQLFGPEGIYISNVVAKQIGPGGKFRRALSRSKSDPTL